MSDVATCRKVLVVEDDEAIRGLLVSALRREPLEVHVAADGEQASNLAAAHAYALMLVDFMLPRMTGLDFLRSFRTARPSAPTVVIMMTASDDELLRTFACDLAHGYVRKPFDIIGLVQIVSDIASGWESAAATNRQPNDESWLVC